MFISKFTTGVKNISIRPATSPHANADQPTSSAADTTISRFSKIRTRAAVSRKTHQLSDYSRGPLLPRSSNRAAGLELSRPRGDWDKGALIFRSALHLDSLWRGRGRPLNMSPASSLSIGPAARGDAYLAARLSVERGHTFPGLIT